MDTRVTSIFGYSGDRQLCGKPQRMDWWPSHDKLNQNLSPPHIYQRTLPVPKSTKTQGALKWSKIWWWEGHAVRGMHEDAYPPQHLTLHHHSWPSPALSTASDGRCGPHAPAPSIFRASWFGSYGWQGLCILPWCLAWTSEVEGASSGHWTTRDLPAPGNIS